VIRALVVHCHPNPASFTAAVRDVTVQRLNRHDAAYRLLDLYALDFDPILTRTAHADYLDTTRNQTGLEEHIDSLRWCNTLIFIYPTWWYGLPARLKGWLDRVFIPGVAFHMPDANARSIQPGLTNVHRLAVFTTCGASWLTTQIMGAPGKRTLLRGARALCARRVRVRFSALYLMDSTTRLQREHHLARTSRKLDRLLA